MTEQARRRVAAKTANEKEMAAVAKTSNSTTEKTANVATMENSIATMEKGTQTAKAVAKNRKRNKKNWSRQKSQID